jgi:tRNA pseudouridine38-40 synthase
VPRFKLTIEHAGTRQRLADSEERENHSGEIDRAVRTVTGRKDFELYGWADAGVHAIAQVAHLTSARTSRPKHCGDASTTTFRPTSTSSLLTRSRTVPRPARRRGASLPVSGRPAAHRLRQAVRQVKEALDVERMQRPLRLVGTRDFKSFAVADDDDEGGKSTLVLLERLDIGEDGSLVLVSIEGSHFLWKMVRRMVGVIVEIGRGGLDPNAVAEYLTETSAAPAKLTAPASGLFLERVYYKNERRDAAVRAATPLS